MREISKLYIHCTASNNQSHDDVSVIRSWHLKRKFKDVGYHFFIKKNGTIQLGRPIGIIGSHAKGHNTGSIGICYHGLGGPTPEQEKTLIDLSKMLMEIFDIKPYNVLGHYEVNSTKTCPDIDMDRFRERL